MREEVVENAVIKSVRIGYEDHGIMTMHIHCEFASGGCGFGGETFDAYDSINKKRFGTGYSTEFIARCLKTVGVDDPFKMTGKHIRVKHTGLGGGIISIGHIINDVWFDPKQLVAEMIEQESNTQPMKENK